MIIKSMSRKDATFAQLVTYISRDHAADRRFALTHNLLAQDQDAIVAELEGNARRLKARKNGVVMYHEIISITRGTKLSLTAQKEALRRIALDYVSVRAPKCLAYGMLHSDHKDHLHYHLVISSNERDQAKRHSLTRAQFRAIQLWIEQRVLADYPDLEQTLAIGKRATRKKSKSGAEVERRLGKKPQIELLKARIADAFHRAGSPEDLFKLLTDERLELYQRGKAIGVRDLDKNRNHRLDTLGLTDAFKIMSHRFEAKAAVRNNLDRPELQEVPDMKTPLPIPTRLPPGLKAAQAFRHVTPHQPVKPDPQFEREAEAARRHAAEFAPNVVGGVAKEATGIMEIAVNTIGGPKPHNAQQQAVAAQVPTPTPAPRMPMDLPQKAAPTLKPKPETELERIARERREALDKLREEQIVRSLDGPKFTR